MPEVQPWRPARTVTELSTVKFCVDVLVVSLLERGCGVVSVVSGNQ